MRLVRPFLGQEGSVRFYDFAAGAGAQEKGLERKERKVGMSEVFTVGLVCP